MARHAPNLRLRHMLDAARRASAFIVGRSRQDLDQEDLQTQGLVRMLEIIGEAGSGENSVARSCSTKPWPGTVMPEPKPL